MQSVGGSPNGRPLRALVFDGNDLYLASKDSLSVIKNAVATTCQGGLQRRPNRRWLQRPRPRWANHRRHQSSVPGGQRSGMALRHLERRADPGFKLRHRAKWDGAALCLRWEDTLTFCNWTVSVISGSEMIRPTVSRTLTAGSGTSLQEHCPTFLSDSRLTPEPRGRVRERLRTKLLRFAKRDIASLGVSRN